MEMLTNKVANFMENKRANFQRYVDMQIDVKTIIDKMTEDDMTTNI
jgi:hypothetical protein